MNFTLLISLLKYCIVARFFPNWCQSFLCMPISTPDQQDCVHMKHVQLFQSSSYRSSIGHESDSISSMVLPGLFSCWHCKKLLSTGKSSLSWYMSCSLSCDRINCFETFQLTAPWQMIHQITFFPSPSVITLSSHPLSMLFAQLHSKTVHLTHVMRIYFFLASSFFSLLRSLSWHCHDMRCT